eukprot:scaffold117231_cov32-Tisochrysis_lutea.AAC.5
MQPNSVKPLHVLARLRVIVGSGEGERVARAARSPAEPRGRRESSAARRGQLPQSRSRHRPPVATADEADV